MTLKNILNAFLKSNKISGLILILCTIFSLILSNSQLGEDYIDFWNSNLMGKSLGFWINDVLMTFFFLLIGLELERELYTGELSKIKDAILPLFAAIGGMLVPAIIYIGFNGGNEYSSGFGIPMATDIAFAIGVLALLGKRVPTSLKVFLLALAIFDDLGAILIIAFFYSKEIVLSNLLIALGIFAVLIFLNYKKVHKLYPYLIGGAIMWYFIYNSGIHPTITGVLVAFAIPFRKSKEVSCSRRLELFLHNPVSFFVIPLFALANTAIRIEGDFSSTILQPYSIGIILGLFLGKPFGIWLMSLIGVKLKLCTLPIGLKFKHIFSVGIIAGIGFTMSIFITLLAFNDITIQNNAKFSILIASLLAAITGLITLKLTLKAKTS